jgi:23S rRNA (uridine2552-2'-O)-methyltransferase
MAKSASSRQWLREHAADRYVQLAKREGYRARSAYKLLEIDRRDRLLRPGMTVVDLGAAPGGWSQVCAERIGRKGCLVAVDLLPMEPLPNAVFIQGDFTEGPVLLALAEALGDRQPELVISDMAPNITGIASIDNPRSMYLVELVRDFCLERLTRQGAMLVKIFQGQGFDSYFKDLRTRFVQVQVRKPGASRGRSAETYLLAKGLR